MKMFATVTLVVMIAGVSLAEDKLILKDGQIVTGDIISEGDANVEIDSGEETIRVPTWAIEKIERDDKAPAGKADRARGAAEREFKAAPEMLLWIDVCIKRLASTNSGVLGSAKAALRAAGPAARTPLKKAAAGENEAIARNAKQLLTQLDRKPVRTAAAEAGRPAPSPPSPETENAQKTTRMVRSLALEGDQKTQFEKIVAGHFAEQTKISEGVRGKELTREQAAANAAALREQTRAKLGSLLNAEQLKQYDALEAKLSGRRVAGKDKPKAAAAEPKTR